MPTDWIDTLVIGAGVTGLACACEIANTGRSVAIVERHSRAGLDTSTHNSGVIHAGIYYPAGSLKARLCVEGRHLLYPFCEAHAVPHRRCGKLIVARTENDVPRLEALQRTGVANGVEGLEFVDEAFVRAREPHLHAVAALHSPVTGILEPEALVRALLRLAQERGAHFLPGTPVIGGEPQADGIEVPTPTRSLACSAAKRSRSILAAGSTRN
jgi:L-2-hydroxyglutarate oxidase LhgO